MNAGELIKSSPDIQISFLRQEFREDLRDERTLKQEFLSAFDKVMQLEAEYAQCEQDLASAGDDADAMQAALNRMAELQVRAGRGRHPCRRPWRPRRRVQPPATGPCCRPLLQARALPCRPDRALLCR